MKIGKFIFLEKFGKLKKNLNQKLFQNVENLKKFRTF